MVAPQTQDRVGPSKAGWRRKSKAYALSRRHADLYLFTQGCTAYPTSCGVARMISRAPCPQRHPCPGAECLSGALWGAGDLSGGPGLAGSLQKTRTAGGKCYMDAQRIFKARRNLLRESRAKRRARKRSGGGCGAAGEGWQQRCSMRNNVTWRKERASPFPAARVCACVPEHMARTSPPSRLPRLPLSSWRRQGIGGLEGRAPVHSIGEHRPTGPPPPTTHPSTKRRRAGHARSNPYRPEPSLRCPEDVRRWSLLCPTFVLSSRLAFAIGPFPHPR